MHTRLTDLLPEFAQALADAFRADGLVELAEQLATLTVWDRCRCDDPGCATFSTAAPATTGTDPLTRLIPNDPIPGLMCIHLHSGRIVSVEILKRPDLKSKLAGAFP